MVEPNILKCFKCKAIKPKSSFRIEPDFSKEFTALKWGNTCRECRDKVFRRDRIHSVRLQRRDVRTLTHARAIKRLRMLADRCIPGGLTYVIIGEDNGKEMAWYYPCPSKVKWTAKILGKYKSKGIG